MRDVFSEEKNEKDLALDAFRDYSLPVTRTPPDTMKAPQQINADFTAINPVLVEEKQTEKFVEEYFVNGQNVGGYRCADGLHQYCPLDGRTLVRVIPNGEFEVKTFVIVREYVTTRWEVVEK